MKYICLMILMSALYAPIGANADDINVNAFQRWASLDSNMVTNATSSKRAKEYQEAAVTCFLTGEQTSGMNKICYYDCLGSRAAITVSAVQLCPLSIKQ